MSVEKAKALLKFGSQAMYAMRLEEATGAFTQAVDAAKAAKHERMHARALARLLNVMAYQGKADDMFKAFSEAGKENVLNGGDEVAGLIIQSCFVRFLKPDSEKAKQFVQDFVNGLAKFPQDPDVARGCGNVALVCNNMGDRKLAASLLERALPVMEAAHTANNPEYAMMLYNLADLRCSMEGYKNFDKLEPAYRRAIAIQEATLAPGHPERVAPLMTTGMLISASGRFDESKQMLDKALSIAVAVEGPQGVGPQMVRNALSEVEARLLDPKAEDYLLKRVEAAEKDAAAQPLEVAARLAALCRHYYARGKPKSAEPHYRKMMAITEKLDEMGRAIVSSERGIPAKIYILLQQKKGELAEKLLLGELETMERVHPAGHEEILQHLYFTGNIYRMMERHKDALKCFERYAEALRKRGDSDAALADGLARLLDAQLQLGKRKEAEASAAEIERLTGKKPVMDASLNEIARQLNNVWHMLQLKQAPDLIGAAQKGDPVAALVVGLCFAVGQGVPASMDKAGPWFKIAAAANDPTVQKTLALFESDSDAPVDFALIATVAQAWVERTAGR